ncbi:FkbM family methyltransferase [Dyadobacter bucti]|uniref:FkbM family methyltransferase n=1 Tax=Dyadobacter bucti TaxID=2572203 RepID=UPI001107F6B9|nr:FkbM family methyltransferase [Dyadobacter bucti]
MKNFIRNILQRSLGFKNYLFFFSLYSIKTIDSGNYEREFIKFLKMIKKRGIILDIGANIGITAAPLAKNAPNAEIHAYEPISENFSTLGKVTGFLKLKNVKLFNLALGNQEGTLKMIMPLQGNSRMQGLSKAYEEGSDEKGILYEVPLKRLDDLYPAETEINAIKLDVENFELEVLRGGKKLLKRNKPMIYCELWDNENRKLVFELIKSIGYDIYVFDPKTDHLDPLESATDIPGNNFFFIHPAHL